jgi:KDO2-lipid IV(A) lauroyltransferase
MLKDFLVVRAYFAGWAIVRLLPEKIAYSLFARIAKYFVDKNGKSVKRLRRNLSQVDSDITSAQLELLVEKAMKSYMRYWCDTFRSPDWSKESIRSRVVCTNEEFLTGPMRRGEGVIVALPHAGNWDLAGAYFTSMGFQLVTVAERLKPEALFERFLEHRQSLGMEVLPLDGRAMGTLVQRARAGKLIALVADRDLSSSGVRVQFFGAEARMPAGPALIAIRTGVPLVTAFVSYTDSGIHIDFKRIVIPEEGSEQEKLSVVVQSCADNFALGIKEHPQDWHMLQQIWTDESFKESA